MQHSIETWNNIMCCDFIAYSEFNAIKQDFCKIEPYGLQ